MIEIFEKNEDGDKTKVFLAIEDGEVSTITIGNRSVSKKTGIQFYVDEYVALQLYKMHFTMDGLRPKLEMRDGEELVIPEKSDKEKEIERLRKQLEELENAE